MRSHTPCGGACDRKTFASRRSVLSCGTKILFGFLQSYWPPLAAHDQLHCFFLVDATMPRRDPPNVVFQRVPMTVRAHVRQCEPTRSFEQNQLCNAFCQPQVVAVPTEVDRVWLAVVFRMSWNLKPSSLHFLSHMCLALRGLRDDAQLFQALVSVRIHVVLPRIRRFFPYHCQHCSRSFGPQAKPLANTDTELAKEPDVTFKASGSGQHTPRQRPKPSALSLPLSSFPL